jgi:hypothetical protein
MNNYGLIELQKLLTIIWTCQHIKSLWTLVDLLVQEDGHLWI